MKHKAKSIASLLAILILFLMVTLVDCQTTATPKLPTLQRPTPPAIEWIEIGDMQALTADDAVKLYEYLARMEAYAGKLQLQIDTLGGQ